MDDYNIMVGERIRNSRKRLKLTMKELGEKVGLHESTISRYENGDIANLNIEKIKEFAYVLNVPVSYLTGWNSSPSEVSKSQKWCDALADMDFTDEEFEDLMNYAKFILSKRELSTE